MNGNGYCSVSCCYQEVKQRGLCKTHLSRFYRTGSTDRIRIENKGTLCRAEKCGKPAKKMGHCTHHYLKMKRDGHLNPRPQKRTHPLYSLWFERKQGGSLGPAWLDFWTFVNDIGEKPSKNHFLMRLRGEEQFGPTNFTWLEKLKKRDDETVKEWHARKWASRMLAHPTFDSNRKFVSNYGITLAQYEELLASQDGKCAICEQPETSGDGKTGTIKRLCVDHCHNTGKVRGLLCFRCNGTLGKMEESPQLFSAMWDYMHKHSKVTAD